MSVTVTAAACPTCPPIPYESWDCWRALQQGGGVFFLDERRGHPCTHCLGARQALYRVSTGWTWLPCSTCWGSGEAPHTIVVRLVERRAAPR